MTTMGEHSPQDKDATFDVVMVHGATDDGAGAKVLRARPGRLDAGEGRPMREGKPRVPSTTCTWSTRWRRRSAPRGRRRWRPTRTARAGTAPSAPGEDAAAR